MPRAPHALDWLSLLVLTVLWGSAFLLNELALRSFPPPVLVAGRIIIGALVVYAYLRLSGSSLPRSPRAWIPMAVIAVLGNVLPFNLIAWSQQHIDSSMAGVLMAIMPLFVLTLSHFFVPGSRLTLFRALGFTLGFAGIVVVIDPDVSGGLNHDLALLGALAALGAAFSYAVTTIYTRRLGNGDPMRRAAGMLIIASFLSAPAALIDLSRVSAPGVMALLALVLLGLLATGFATLLYFHLIQGPGPTFLSLVNFLVPVWAVLAGAVLLDETLTPSMIAGLALILSGIALSEFGTKIRLVVGVLRRRVHVQSATPVARERL